MTLKELSDVLDESVTIRLIDINDESGLTCYASDLGWLKDEYLNKNIESIRLSFGETEIMEVSIA